MVKQQLSTSITQLKHRARRIAREKSIPLHQALDQVAKSEGFNYWSLLAAKHPDAAIGAPTDTDESANSYRTKLTPGDLILVAARPGHGKTAISLTMLLDAVSSGRPGMFFTLEYNEQQAAEKLQSLIQERGTDFNSGDIENIEIDSSDDISAPYIISRLSATPPGAVIVIDYLQLLDQKRTSPDLSQQLADLGKFAIEREICMIFISQVHRSFDMSKRAMPTVADIRLPNPVDLGQFNKTCFLHNDEVIWSELVKQ